MTDDEIVAVEKTLEGVARGLMQHAGVDGVMLRVVRGGRMFSFVATSEASDPQTDDVLLGCENAVSEYLSKNFDNYQMERDELQISDGDGGFDVVHRKQGGAA